MGKLIYLLVHVAIYFFVLPVYFCLFHGGIAFEVHLTLYKELQCSPLYYTTSNLQTTSIALDMSPMLVNEIKTQLHWFFKNVYNYTVHLLSLII